MTWSDFLSNWKKLVPQIINMHAEYKRLKVENKALIDENTRLIDENKALIDENNRLKVTLTFLPTTPDALLVRVTPL